MSEKFETLLKVIDSLKIPSMLSLFEGNKDRFCKAPASSKYHGSYPGGLIDHTMLVMSICTYLYKFDTKNIKGTTHESLIKCAALHDFGKVGTKEQDFYIPDPSSQKYIQNKNDIHLDHEHLSLYWINLYSIPLTAEEIKCISYHAGSYSPAFTLYKETPQHILLSTADNMAAKIYNI